MENETNEEALILSEAEARVLGCLLEKAVTTPDVYPLTFNSLLTACNQKTNRDPVVDYDEDVVAEAIEGLRGKQLIYRADGAGSRVQKYRHRIDERFGLSAASQALLTVLLLRGPQTPGELRTRTERMHVFLDVAAVEAEIAATAEDVDLPLWTRLPQAPGQKEARYMHCLYGTDFVRPTESVEAAPAPAVAAVQQRSERVTQLETRVDELERELAELKASFASFRQQFD
ncbi:YceH family protein [Coraliomargarita akajimensis]|uniref:Uncharacterized protein n=1 Tax=Coraliomargarita akajimensis (strain DSM 45221 / IAM 15411 / JCM 23193 / KCTC 12865 / 04OKA010-24) TaxID=583355 RepID=D5EQ00_CORAD|nr:YceH family protein [Coraliomargarita akajimensis]ADE55733.1 protein of unknown function DUF480 [Coraliomargarita akajimensis DSM 45221]